MHFVCLSLILPFLLPPSKQYMETYKQNSYEVKQKGIIHMSYVQIIKLVLFLETFTL